MNNTDNQTGSDRPHQTSGQARELSTPAGKADDYTINPQRQLLRNLPLEEVEQFERAWQSEHAAVAREELTRRHEQILTQLNQAEALRQRLNQELQGIDQELSDLYAEQDRLKAAQTRMDLTWQLHNPQAHRRTRTITPPSCKAAP